MSHEIRSVGKSEPASGRTTREFAYGACAVLVGIDAVHVLLGSLLGAVGLSLPHIWFVDLLLGFGSLIPNLVAFAVPYFVHVAAGYLMLALVLRRAWLFFARRKRTPASFTGLPKALGYIALGSFGLGLGGLVLALILGVPFGAPAGLLMIPATFGAPWAFLLTEVQTFGRSKAGSLA
ncbi:hypothetical protein [Ramlibacter sp.]|uniref:hypothetical protein n=1 Tax=Ramlibacter sp. TaxID=1917967 RepID=UPI002D398299|nr:hypothetical protein [Ramlibacter sp.]HYD75074.1 hypothetical protein [Ramlibacter sp.]